MSLSRDWAVPGALSGNCVPGGISEEFRESPEVSSGRYEIGIEGTGGEDASGVSSNEV